MINWPNVVPFVNASEIRSLHTFHLLHTTLTLDDISQHCHWVSISKEEWEKRKNTYHTTEAAAPALKWKQAPTGLQNKNKNEPPVQVGTSAKWKGKWTKRNKAEGGKKTGKVQGKGNIKLWSSKHAGLTCRLMDLVMIHSQS